MLLTTQFAEDEIAPRVCGCDFCLKHRPNWFSDRTGQLAVNYAVEPTRYRFGSETADFLICPRCGVVVAAICKSDGKTIGVFNLNCLEAHQDWPAQAQDVNYDGEELQNRVERRAANWMPVSLKAIS
ncbi:GFA family protein [Erythrobacter rubeus]|uniref:CENP-V/GFA domain-containing protein n=1 Tax=Erythrobacter rubeus TaxID=2760803 RepID=A0ABR8KUL5_9SPHN|nr:hypothetical protein [Erythrobacter rubeus]MBD2841947.1 hypothetical protein [Erythrobacter rubeus]